MNRTEIAKAVAETSSSWLGPIGQPEPMSTDQSIPQYIRAWYDWAYLDRRNARLLDHEAVVTAILFGNSSRLRRAVLSEIAPGQSVLQVAHVYGNLIPQIAGRLGPDGRLDVIDIVPLQAARCRHKLHGFPGAHVRVADASEPGEAVYDVVNCYFLLHEVPDDRKSAIVNALLRRVGPGGRVVFVDYHRPARGHPLRGFYRRLFERVEPYALAMWNREIREYATDASAFDWQKQTMFGGVFQKIVARRADGKGG